VEIAVLNGITASSNKQSIVIVLSANGETSLTALLI